MSASAAALVAPDCPLCHLDPASVLWQDGAWCVIRVSEAGFPGFFRVVARAHVAEFSDLTPEARQHCMAIVNVVEAVLRAELAPTKINLASLGNVVPHVHWHVIARFAQDSHFPAPIWANAQRPADPAWLAALVARMPAVEVALQRALAAAFVSDVN